VVEGPSDQEWWRSPLAVAVLDVASIGLRGVDGGATEQLVEECRPVDGKLVSLPPCG